MGGKEDTEFLKGLIETKRGNLQRVLDEARKCPRPQNACTSHDNMFGVMQAQAECMDVLLLLQQKNIGGVSNDVMAWVKTLMWPVSVAVSFIAFSPQAPAIAEAITKALVK